MRLTIKPHHDAYIKLIASQMGCDLSTTLDYFLWELRKMGYSFSHPLPMPTQPVMQSSVPVGVFTPFQEVIPQSQDEPDEVIERFLSLGLDTF